MWSFMSQSGIASVIVDFTDNLSSLLVGLVAVMAVSAGMIVWEAVRHYLSQKYQSVKGTTSTAPDYRDAA